MYNGHIDRLTSTGLRKIFTGRNEHKHLKSPTPPATMGQTFDVRANLGVINTELAMRMKKAVGFRNIAIRNYVALAFSSKFIRYTGKIQT